MERLTVSSDGRRLETRSGRPFLYLADTAWTLPQRLKHDDARHYMRTRRAQGFTALQIVALDPERDVEMRSPDGHPALHDGDLDRPNEAYFAYLDRVLDMAEEHGFRVLLLPVWGQLVVGESWGGGTFPKTVTAENAFRFGRWIGERYRDRTSIVWCLGGDRQPIHRGVDYRDVWRRMAEGLAQGVTGRAARWDEPSEVWRELVITYHTCFEMETGEYSTMSYWTDEDAWISFIALQSGHGLSTRSYEAVEREVARPRRLPVIDVEPAYERMPMNWPELFPLHDDAIVRRRAYWAMLAGASGHTYGHASVWCMISEKERNEVLDATWFEALSHPGAGQMATLRHLAETLPFERWVPDRTLVDHACADDCLDAHRQAAVDREGRFAIAYLSDGGAVRMDLSRLDAEVAHVAWLDPRTGALDAAVRVEDPDRRLFTAPTSGPGRDWLLVAVADPALLERLATTPTWGDVPETPRMSMVWAE